MRLFGLIGYPLSHSFSKKYFDAKFIQEGIQEAYFENYSIENIALLENILKNPDLKGLAVTIPYKRAVLEYLDTVSDSVQEMGACNCVKIEDGKYLGFNTDIIGFEKSFTKLWLPQHQQALILGTGGAASAVAFALKKLNIPYRFVSREKDPEGKKMGYEELNETVLTEYQIVINCSPLGTYPKIEEAPPIPYQYVNRNHYFFDLVYNPAETKFLYLAKQQGAIVQNGYEMLTLQAEENWAIWNS